MKIVKTLLIVGGLGMIMASCATHAPCPGLGGENIDKERMQIPVQSDEILLEEEQS
ncbi:MAG: hypothetical protein ACI9J3_001276 [Parvicellaceae bacterium]|jgi:hypothetical protein